MKVILSFIGKFASKGHGEVAYNISKPFFKKGYLAKIFLSSFINTDIPNSMFSCVKTGVIHGLRHFSWGDSLNYAVRDNIFDLKVSRLIDECDLFLGWPNASLFSLRKAKKLKAKTAVFSFSTHILTHNRLIQEECRKLSQSYTTNNFLINKQLREYEEADYINVFSDVVVNTFLENGVPKEKMIFIPYGVDTNMYKPSKKSDDIFRILIVGRICLRKGVQYVLEAWSRLKLKNSELVLIGELDREMRDIVRDYKKKCDFKIYNFTDDLIKFYSQASVIVCASVEEGSTIVAYEALSCAVPVIASKNSAVGHIVKDGVTGFIIPNYSADAIEEKIKFLHANRDVLVNMGTSARDDMVNNHTSEKFGQEIVSRYERILAK